MIGGKNRAKKIDYKNKKFENPFFNKKKKAKKIKKINKIPNLKIKFYFSLGFLFIVFILWLMFYSNIFFIQKIVVEGTVRAQPNEIANEVLKQTEGERFFIGTQNNIFVFDTEELKNNLMERYDFKSINILKERPGTIKIKVDEKNYAYVWKEKDKYYYADIDGYIIKEVNPLEIKESNYPLVNNQGDDKIYENKILVSEEKINFITEIFSYLQKNNSYDIEVETFIIDNDEHKVTLRIIGGPEVYFNSEESADAQITKLSIIKDERLKEDFYSKSYIDLRYGDKVYYR